MPIYEYSCGGCDAVFEELLSIKDMDNAVACPKCGAADKATRLVTCPAGVVKGGAGSGDADYNFRRLLDQRVQEGSAARAKDGTVYTKLPGDVS